MKKIFSLCVMFAIVAMLYGVSYANSDTGLPAVPKKECSITKPVTSTSVDNTALSCSLLYGFALANYVDVTYDCVYLSAPAVPTVIGNMAFTVVLNKGSPTTLSA